MMSADEATRMRPRRTPGVIVSVRDPVSAPAPLNSRWKAVLRLELADLSCDGLNDPFAEGLAEQAAASVALVHAHRKSPLIAFHGHAGISRSGTAAAGHMPTAALWAWLRTPPSNVSALAATLRCRSLDYVGVGASDAAACGRHLPVGLCFV